MPREPRRTPTPAEFSPLRRAVAIDAEICEPLSCFLPIRIVDLSLSGCRVWAGFRLTEGRSVRLAIPGFAPVRATTISARQGYAGLRFDTPLHPSILQHLVACYPALSATG